MKWLARSLALAFALNQVLVAGAAGFPDLTPSASNKDLQCELKPLGSGKDDTDQARMKSWLPQTSYLKQCTGGGSYREMRARGHYDICRGRIQHYKVDAPFVLADSE
jgi:hypothetical protein